MPRAKSGCRLDNSIVTGEQASAEIISIEPQITRGRYRIEIAKWSCVKIDNPPGLAGEIVKAIDATAHRPLPLASVPASLQLLAICGGIGNRKALNGGKMNIITLTVAPTAAGKEAAQSFIRASLLRLQRSKHVFNRPRTDKDMILNALDAGGRALYMVDEAHDLMATVKDKGSSQHTKAIGALMLEMATTNLYVLSGTHKRELTAQITKTREQTVKRIERLDKKIDADEHNRDLHAARAGAVKLLTELDLQQTVIENGIVDPLACFMMNSTPGNFEKVIDYTNIASGLIGRALLFHCGDEAAPLRKGRAAVGVPPSIIERLEKISSNGEPLQANDDTRLYLDVIFDYLEEDERRNAPIIGALYRRAFERVIAVASLLALETGTVTDEHVAYAFALVMRNIKDAGILAQQNEVQDSQVLLMKRIIEIASRSPVGKSLSPLRKDIMRKTLFAEEDERAKLNGFKSPFDLAIKALEENGVIRLDERNGGIVVKVIK